MMCFCQVMLYLNGSEFWRPFNWATVYMQEHRLRIRIL